MIVERKNPVLKILLIIVGVLGVFLIFDESIYGYDRFEILFFIEVFFMVASLVAGVIIYRKSHISFDHLAFAILFGLMQVGFYFYLEASGCYQGWFAGLAAALYLLYVLSVYEGLFLLLTLVLFFVDRSRIKKQKNKGLKQS